MDARSSRRWIGVSGRTASMNLSALASRPAFFVALLAFPPPSPILFPPMFPAPPGDPRRTLKNNAPRPA